MGQTRQQRCREAAAVGRVHVEPDRGALEGEAIARRVTRRFRGADPWGPQPWKIEGQVAQRVIIRRVLRVAARYGGIGKRAGRAGGAQCSGRVGAGERHARTAGQRGSDRVRAGDPLLCGECGRACDAQRHQCPTHGA